MTQKPKCVVLGQDHDGEIEFHHFAPKHLFGPGDADLYPVLPLCHKHHAEWHAIVTPTMMTRKTFIGKVVKAISKIQEQYHGAIDLLVNQKVREALNHPRAWYGWVDGLAWIDQVYLDIYTPSSEHFVATLARHAAEYKKGCIGAGIKV